MDNEVRIVIALSCLLIVTIGVAIAISFLSIPNIGVIKTINLEANPLTLNWGIIEPSTSISKVLYVHSTGTVPVTLSFNVENWNPPNAQTYMIITWNYSGQLIQDWTPLQFTLTVDSAIVNITNFSFDLVIVGTA